MNKSVIVGIVVTILFGTLLHFTYEWSGNNPVVGLFSAINESTWEHLKLLFFPFLIYTIVEYVYIGHEYPNYFSAKAIGVFVGLLAIPLIFNTYTALLGTNYLVLDILIFIVGVIISYVVSYLLLKKGGFSLPALGIAVFVILTLAFFLFTFMPPTQAFFLDPVTKQYGMIWYKNSYSESRHR